MTASPRQPNVLLITTDQQRYDALSVNNPLVQTPNLNRLAGMGTTFCHGYVQNPVCIPSRACIQTGRYVHQHGVDHMVEAIGDTPGLPPWETTFMERLQQADYATAAFGKIHMLPPKGLDELGLTMGKGARWTVAEGSPLGPSQLGPVYGEWLERKHPGATEALYAQRRQEEYRGQATAIVNVLPADEYVDYWIAEQTWDYLERSHERPFFAWCGFCGPHPPYDPPESYASRYRPNDVPLPRLLHARQQGVDGGDRPSRFDRPDGEALIRKITAYYWAMTTFIDDMVGRIMETLTRRGLWDNTLVIFTSDHGDMLGDFGKLGKENFTEPVVRVPYLLVPPGSVPSNGGAPEQRHYDGLVEHMDLAPTMLDYAGIPQPPSLPGVSLRPILEAVDLTDPALGGKEAILCEYVPKHQRWRSMCLRTDRYKYVFSGAGRPVEFYDLQADPNELTNVASDPAYRQEVVRHAELLLDRLVQTQQTAWSGDPAMRTTSHNAPKVDAFGQRL
jgi:arylsulfatase A-like enzyme